MLTNLIRPSAMTKMIIRADPHPSHRSLFNSDDSSLVKHNVKLELGRVHNINKNPVAEKAIGEMIHEMLILQPQGGPMSSATISKATANLNSRIRAPGVSAHEIFTQRDQVTGQQLTLDDMKLIEDQLQRREVNHKSSEKCKAGGKPVLPDAQINVGSIVYLYSDGSKLRARPRYVVLSVKDGWCTVRRFAERQLGRLTYSIKLSECYQVPDETKEAQLPTYTTLEGEEDDMYVTSYKQKAEITPAKKDVEAEETESADEEDESREEESCHCRICHREVAKEHQGLLCDSCDQWSHRNCLKMPKKRYTELTKVEDLQWICPACPQDVDVGEEEEDPPEEL